MVFAPSTPSKQLAGVGTPPRKYSFLLEGCCRPISLYSASSLVSPAMALSMVYVVETPWSPHPLCPPHIVPILERAVGKLPPAFLLEPVRGEVFETKEDCLKRLQGHALSVGFAVVLKSGSLKSERPRFQFRCIHHGTKTLNTRGLEEDVEYNIDGEIVSQRKQQATATQQKDCNWATYLALKDISVRGSGSKGLVLSITNNSHSHLPAPNPLRYKIHEKALEEYQEAVRLAQIHRETLLSYSASQRILDRAGYALDRRTYYNLCQRPMSSISSHQDLFYGLVAALEEAGFKYTLRFDDKLNNASKVISSQLQQIFFIHPIQINLAQRFIPGFLFLIDGIFNTNRLNLVLISIVGINNLGLSFPAGISFARSESKTCFDFIFKAINK
jgi:MULE transposase domain